MATADVTGRLAQYMVQARDWKLAPEVAQDARHRILDTLAAMVSGSHLKPGEMAIQYARAQGGTEEATVVATDIRATAVNAALANAMFGHADETDDFHPATKAHPGCAVVPAALAMAEREGASGAALLSAVALGYDLCCRFLLALGADLVRASHRSAEGTSSTMGAVGAAAALARLDEKGMRHSYERMKDPKVLAAKAKVQLVGDKALMDPAAPRSGKVEVTLKDGRTVSHFTRHAPGTKENPMDTERVNAKARVLMEPVLGAGPTEEIIRRVNALEQMKNVRVLRPFLARG